MSEKEKKERRPLDVSRAFAVEVARLADDRHLTNIVVLELADTSPVARHFVIATGASDQQLRSVAKQIVDLGKEHGFPTFGNAGLQQGKWAVVDLVDVVVHLFDEEYREFYDLELLWGDVPRVEWQRD